MLARYRADSYPRLDVGWVAAVASAIRIAKTLGIAPSTYHAAKKRPPSARAVRDAQLRPQILRVWEENLAVYGADKIWDQLNKDEVRVARWTVERLMRDMGLQGCRRGRLEATASFRPRLRHFSMKSTTPSKGVSLPATISP